MKRFVGDVCVDVMLVPAPVVYYCTEGAVADDCHVSCGCDEASVGKVAAGVLKRLEVIVEGFG